MLGSALLFGLGPAALADSHATEIGCTTITEPGVYHLTSDLSGHDGTCLVVESPNVTIDGQGHTISNVNGTAILLNEYDRNGLTVRNLVIENPAGGGIRAQWTEDVTIEDVTVRDAGGIGIALGDDVSGVTIDGVTVTGSEEGIFMGDVSDATITDTELRENDEWGLRVYDFAQPRIEDTVIAGNQHGIQVELAGGFDAQGIEIRDNDVGVAFAEDAPINTSLHDSVIAGNGAGVTTDTSGERVDLNLTHNYWGAESGPSSAGDEPVADPQTGALANGSGDSIDGRDGTAAVRFDPWLTAEGGSPPTETTTTEPTTGTSDPTTSSPTTEETTARTTETKETSETSVTSAPTETTPAQTTTAPPTTTETTVQTTETTVATTRPTPTTQTDTPAPTTTETPTTTTTETAAGTPQTDTATDTVGDQPIAVTTETTETTAMNPTETRTETDTKTLSEGTEPLVGDTTTDGIEAPPAVPGIPGFGPVVAIIALIAATLLALRRD